MIDEDKLKMGIGVELSYLPMEIQELVHRVISKEKGESEPRRCAGTAPHAKEDSLTPESVSKIFQRGTGRKNARRKAA